MRIFSYLPLRSKGKLTPFADRTKPKNNRTYPSRTSAVIEFTNFPLTIVLKGKHFFQTLQGL